MIADRHAVFMQKRPQPRRAFPAEDFAERMPMDITERKPEIIGADAALPVVTDVQPVIDRRTMT